jgi:hypothetical protein
VTHDLGGGFQAHVAGPGEATLRHGHRDFGWGAVGDLDASGGASVGLDGIGVGDGGGQADAAGAGREGAQAGDTERKLVAALGAGQRVDLVHDDAVEGCEERGGVGEGEQDGQAFGSGEQQMGWRDLLARAAIGGGVAGAGLDGDGQAHVLDRAGQVAGDVGSQGFQRGDVDGVEAGAWVVRQVDEAREEAGEGLAAAGGGDQQDAVVCFRCIQHGELVGAGGPALVGEPGQKWFR